MEEPEVLPVSEAPSEEEIITEEMEDIPSEEEPPF